MKRKTLPLALAAGTFAVCMTAGSLVACAPGNSRDVERICVTSILREPVDAGNCESGSGGYVWADEDDFDFDKIKLKKKSTTVVRPVVPQPKQPVVVKPPSQPKPPAPRRK